MDNTFVPNKTMSVPDDVVLIIESLSVPFSKWVTDQLRRHAAPSTASFADQILADAVLAAPEKLTAGVIHRAILCVGAAARLVCHVCGCGGALLV